MPSTHFTFAACSVRLEYLPASSAVPHGPGDSTSRQSVVLRTSLPLPPWASGAHKPSCDFVHIRTESDFLRVPRKGAQRADGATAGARRTQDIPKEIPGVVRRYSRIARLESFKERPKGPLSLKSLPPCDEPDERACHSVFMELLSNSLNRPVVDVHKPIITRHSAFRK